MIRKITRLLGYELIKTKHHPTLQSHLANFFHDLNIDLVLDVGANNGQFANTLRSIGYSGRIISFEPVSTCFEKLCLLSKNDPLWSVMHLALGDKKEKKTINVFNSTDFSSLLDPNSFGKNTFEQMRTSKKEIIPVDTIDNILSELKLENITNIFLKMDTQGYDLNVFNGASSSLSMIIGMLTEISLHPIYEQMPGYHEVLQIYEKSGFTITGLYPITRNKDLSIIEMDCVMIKQNKLHVFA